MRHPAHRSPALYSYATVTEDGWTVWEIYNPAGHLVEIASSEAEAAEGCDHFSAGDPIGIGPIVPDLKRVGGI